MAALVIAFISQRYSISAIRAEMAKGQTLPLIPLALVTYVASLVWVAAADRTVLAGLLPPDKTPSYFGVAKGTTNTYVAEELLGGRIPHGGYVIGHVLPEKGGKPLPKEEPVPVVVLVKGRHRPDLSLDQALEQLGSGDVVIKGGNALDYANRTVGVWTGSVTGGTAGKVMPVVEARKAHLVIPIGLEKTVVGRVTDIAAKTMETADDPSKLPRMRVLKGEIVTEIEALKILANVDAFEASSGGIGGAEGAVWMVWRGSREDVEKARRIVESIHGEPPFIP